MWIIISKKIKQIFLFIQYRFATLLKIFNTGKGVYKDK